MGSELCLNAEELGKDKRRQPVGNGEVTQNNVDAKIGDIYKTNGRKDICTQ